MSYLLSKSKTELPIQFVIISECNSIKRKVMPPHLQRMLLQLQKYQLDQQILLGKRKDG